jgi:Trp operon repressor
VFFDDENEFRRVMSMLDEKSEPETVERFVTLDLAFKDRDDALNKVKIANARISELEKENNELKNQLKNVK